MSDKSIDPDDVRVTRKPRLKFDLRSLRGTATDDPLADIFQRRLTCVVCGGPANSLGTHHNMIVDHQQGTARADGTLVDACRFHAMRTPGLNPYYGDENITYRDWCNLSVAKTVVRALATEHGHE